MDHGVGDGCGFLASGLDDGRLELSVAETVNNVGNIPSVLDGCLRRLFLAGEPFVDHEADFVLGQVLVLEEEFVCFESAFLVTIQGVQIERTKGRSVLIVDCEQVNALEGFEFLGHCLNRDGEVLDLLSVGGGVQDVHGFCLSKLV